MIDTNGSAEALATIAAIENGDHLAGLLPHHLAKLRECGLTDATITANGIRSETDLLKIGQAINKSYSRKCGPAIAIPYIGAMDETSHFRFRPDNPQNIGGKPAKYLQPKGLPPRVYFPAGTRELCKSKAQPIVITEGEFKALCGTQHGYCVISLPGVDCAFGRKSTRLISDLATIEWAARPVFICFDSDAATNPAVLDAERILAAALAKLGAIVKIVRLPGTPDGAKVGLDDYLAANGASAFHDLLKQAEEPGDVDAGDLREPAIKADPAVVAKAFLEANKVDGVYPLCHWRGGFIIHRQGHHTDAHTSEVRAEIINHLNTHFSNVWTATTSNVMDQVKAMCILRSDYDPPTWIDRKPGDWPAREVLCTKSQLIHLPTMADNGANCIMPATPRFFSQSALEFEAQTDAPPPAAWLEFLDQLWRDDPECIATLQEWFGYCLMPETWLQKIMLLIGPKRSGKGTIARILRELVGRRNVAGQTLAGLGTNFGLWPLIGKLLCIISDARLGGKSDVAIVVEKLLSISGEDALTIDRKNQEPITVRLPTRFMLLTNELPRLGDSSGAVASRMIVLRLTNSFYGCEDHHLTDKLLTELPGILLWAVEGWRRLHERGRMIQPESAQELVNDLEDLSSPIGMFVRERCILGQEYGAAVADLFEQWKDWCEENGRSQPGTQQTFGRDLIAAIPQLRKTQPRASLGGRYRAYDGIAIRSASMQGF